MLRRYVEILRTSGWKLPINLTFHYKPKEPGVMVTLRYDKENLEEIVILSKIAVSMMNYEVSTEVTAELTPLLRYSRPHKRYLDALTTLIRRRYLWVGGYNVLDLNSCTVMYVGPDNRLRVKRKVTDYDIRLESLCRLVEIYSRATKNYVVQVLQQIDDLGV